MKRYFSEKMMKKIDIEDFLELSGSLPVVDVRSPGEFDQGHIPGAHNLPLFSDEERAAVGKIYKNSGKEASVLKGLDIVGPKMSGFVKQAGRIAREKRLLMHCWRGGMRSESMAWLLETAGFHVKVLTGGYKAYRKFIREKLGSVSGLIIISGKTGTGKTEILLEMRKQGVQVVDLEGLAHHKGSAFGALGEAPQPTSEQFENDLFGIMAKLDAGRPVFLEDESRSIGKVIVPEPFFNKMRTAPVIRIEMEKILRIERLVKDYAHFQKAHLIDSVRKIQKKLGGQNAKTIVEAIETGDFETAIDRVLVYYDKTYTYGLEKRDPQKIRTIESHTPDAAENARLVLEAFKQGIIKNF